MRSRAATPLTVGSNSFHSANLAPTSKPSPLKGGLWYQWNLLDLRGSSEAPEQPHAEEKAHVQPGPEVIVSPAAPTPCKGAQESNREKKEPGPLHFAAWDSPRATRAKAKHRPGAPLQDITSMFPATPGGGVRRAHPLPHPSALPTLPDLGPTTTLPQASADADYAVLVSMYEVYNDRIFDLLVPAQPGAGGAREPARRRPLLFKSTEGSRERKVVAGLRKVACTSYDEALLVLEAGLTERRVAGTGSNSVSSRSHGFFCVEVKRKSKGSRPSLWSGAQLTIVDLAGESNNSFMGFGARERKADEFISHVGSERARNAKTAGATLAEAGKINESLMYLGQCLQMQSDCADGSKVCPHTPAFLSQSFFFCSHKALAVRHRPFPPVQAHRAALLQLVSFTTSRPRRNSSAVAQPAARGHDRHRRSGG